MAQRSFAKRLWYNGLHTLTRLASVTCFGTRIYGRHRVPRDAGVLVCCNHQSFYDPIFIGMALDRRLNFLARDSLFEIPLLGRLIASLDAIPIDREGFGMSGIKETLRRLRAGELVLIFPEGTRTNDGEVAPLKPGLCAIARRARVPLLPMALDGAFQAWPKGQKLPGHDTIHLSIGPPMSPELCRELTDQELLEELRQRICTCHEEARRGRSQSCGIGDGIPA